MLARSAPRIVPPTTTTSPPTTAPGWNSTSPLMTASEPLMRPPTTTGPPSTATSPSMPRAVGIRVEPEKRKVLSLLKRRMTSSATSRGSWRIARRCSTPGRAGRIVIVVMVVSCAHARDAAATSRSAIAALVIPSS